MKEKERKLQIEQCYMGSDEKRNRFTDWIVAPTRERTLTSNHQVDQEVTIRRPASNEPGECSIKNYTLQQLAPNNKCYNWGSGCHNLCTQKNGLCNDDSELRMHCSLVHKVTKEGSVVEMQNLCKN